MNKDTPPPFVFSRVMPKWCGSLTCSQPGSQNGVCKPYFKGGGGGGGGVCLTYLFLIFVWERQSRKIPQNIKQFSQIKLVSWAKVDQLIQHQNWCMKRQLHPRKTGVWLLISALTLTPFSLIADEIMALMSIPPQIKPWAWSSKL